MRELLASKPDLYDHRSLWNTCNVEHVLLLLLFRLFIGDTPSDQGEPCTTPCSVFRVIIHFAVYFSVHLEPTEVTQEGANNYSIP